jgi:hypothetical protein
MREHAASERRPGCDHGFSTLNRARASKACRRRAADSASGLQNGQGADPRLTDRRMKRPASANGIFILMLAGENDGSLSRPR